MTHLKKWSTTSSKSDHGWRGIGSSLWWPVVSSCVRESSDWILGRGSLLWGWLDTVTGSPQHQAHQSSNSICFLSVAPGLLLGSSVRGRKFTSLFQIEKFCDRVILCGKNPLKLHNNAFPSSPYFEFSIEQKE